jgi:chemotaxis protein CheC
MIPLSDLAVLNALGELGIEGVSDRLQQLDSYDASVESELVKAGYLTDTTLRSLGTDRRVGVRVGLPGAPYGHALALFPPGSANNAAALMLDEAVDDVGSASEEMATSALTELGGMMINGFLDAWADQFGQRIDVGAPSSVRGPEHKLLAKVARSSDDLGLYITSRLRLPSRRIMAQVYLLPENETFVDIVDRIDADMIG